MTNSKHRMAFLDRKRLIQITKICFRKLKYQQIKDIKFSRFRVSVTKHGETGNLNIFQVFLAYNLDNSLI